MPQLPKSRSRKAVAQALIHLISGPTSLPPALASNAAAPDGQVHGRYARSEYRAKQPQSSGNGAKLTHSPAMIAKLKTSSHLFARPLCLRAFCGLVRSFKIELSATSNNEMPPSPKPSALKAIYSGPAPPALPPALTSDAATCTTRPTGSSYEREPGARQDSNR